MKKNPKNKRNQDISYAEVKDALENPKFKFRTLQGISKETHASIPEIERVLCEHSDEVVRLYRRGAHGEELVTTRKHYNKNASIKEKVIGAIINNVY